MKPVDPDDVAVGCRHIITYREESLYVNIFAPACELFFSSVLENNNQDSILLGGELNMISRMITLAWKGNNLEKVIEQLERSSSVTWDLPGMLVPLLKKEVQV